MVLGMTNNAFSISHVNATFETCTAALDIANKQAAVHDTSYAPIADALRDALAAWRTISSVYPADWEHVSFRAGMHVFALIDGHLYAWEAARRDGTPLQTVTLHGSGGDIDILATADDAQDLRDVS
jgi:hypothetical protein